MLGTMTYEQQELHAGGRKIRKDVMVENVPYQDTGCVMAPACLRCPLERCRDDSPGGARKLLAGDRDETLRRFHDEGAPIDALASRYDLSRRSVFRILAKSA